MSVSTCHLHTTTLHSLPVVSDDLDISCYLASDAFADIEFACNAGDPSLFSGLGRSPGEGKCYPLQYSGLENSMNSIVLGVGKSQTRVSYQVNKLIKGVFPEAEDKVARLLRIHRHEMSLPSHIMGKNASHKDSLFRA